VQLATRRTWRLLAPVLALTLLAAACGSSSKSSDNGSSSDTTLPAAQKDLAAATVTGSGSSFVDPFYQAAIEAFADVAPDVTINYNAVGSGQGKKDFAAGLSNFAGSDSAAKPTEIPASTPFVYILTTAAPITVSYNLSGVSKLQLSANTLAGIFQRTIKTWNDPAIKADNPGVSLPSTAIVVAHRSDGSGTTNNFTAYLTKAATNWTLGTGDTVAWPADTQAGAKNTGVAQIITSTPGAIGYVDLSDATAAKLVFASLKNKSGAYVAPTLDGATAALSGATINDDGTIDPLNTAGATAYPITAPTYLLAHTTYTGSQVAIGKAVIGFVSYLLNQGQGLANGVQFAKLPANILAKSQSQAAKITAQ
jgi:phosphate transport system substrate-binding protein